MIKEGSSLQERPHCFSVYHRNRTYRLIICQHFSVAVQNFSAGRFDTSLPLMEILCFFAVIICPKQHQIPQPPNQKKHRRHAQCKNSHDLFAVKCFDLYKQYKKPHKSFLLLYRCFCEVKTANSLYLNQIKEVPCFNCEYPFD